MSSRTRRPALGATRDGAGWRMGAVAAPRRMPGERLIDVSLSSGRLVAPMMRLLRTARDSPPPFAPAHCSRCIGSCSELCRRGCPQEQWGEVRGVAGWSHGAWPSCVRSAPLRGRASPAGLACAGGVDCGAPCIGWRRVRAAWTDMRRSHGARGLLAGLRSSRFGPGAAGRRPPRALRGRRRRFPPWPSLPPDAAHGARALAARIAGRSRDHGTSNWCKGFCRRRRGFRAVDAGPGRPVWAWGLARETAMPALLAPVAGRSGWRPRLVGVALDEGPGR